MCITEWSAASPFSANDTGLFRYTVRAVSQR